jgi:excisionase family DNA binding protein
MAVFFRPNLFSQQPPRGGIFLPSKPAKAGFFIYGVDMSELTKFEDKPDCALVSDKTVAALLEISKPTVWRWVREGRLPKPRKIGPNITRWEVGPLREALAALGSKEAA